MIKNDLIIIDTDPGSDDAVAILSALASKTPADYAFVSTYGNGPIEITEKNLRGILEHGGFTGLVFHGADRALNGSQPDYDYYHGPDCIGGVSADLYAETNENPNISVAEITELPELAEQYDDITYIALGALSNLATMIREKSPLLDKKIQLLIMGGGLAHYCGPHDSEFNFSRDPEAVKIVLNSGIPIKLFPFDISVDYPITDVDIESFAKRSNDKILNDLLFALLASANRSGRNHADIPDAFPILYRTDYRDNFVFEKMKLISDEYGALKQEEGGAEIEVAVALDNKNFLFRCFSDLFLCS